MPYYLFEDPLSGETKDIFFHMKDDKVYIDETKVIWKRIYTVPQASKDTKSDPYSSKDFVKVTNKNGGNFGELWERSSEFSSRRAEKEGIDPIKQKHDDQIERDTGIVNPVKKKKLAQEKLKKLKISLSERAQNRSRNVQRKLT